MRLVLAGSPPLKPMKLTRVAKFWACDAATVETQNAMTTQAILANPRFFIDASFRAWDRVGEDRHSSRRWCESFTRAKDCGCRKPWAQVEQRWSASRNRLDPVLDIICR